MRLVLISYITLAFASAIQSQSDSLNLDFLIDEYERKYRTELNRSDSSLIENQLREINHKGCAILSEIIESNNYSGTYIAAVTKELIAKSKCTKSIFENINIEIYDERSERPWDLNNFPIIRLLCDSVLNKRFVHDLAETRALKDCDLQFTRDVIPIIYLDELLFSKIEKFYIENKIQPEAYEANWFNKK